MPAASVRAAASAVMFLTRVPLGRRVAVDAADVARGALLFPVVGAGVGALSGGVAVLAHPRLPALAAAALSIAVSVVVTGAMHVDALADTADAVGAPTRERALQIMRDSRIGAFGATALVLDLPRAHLRALARRRHRRQSRRGDRDRGDDRPPGRGGARVNGTHPRSWARIDVGAPAPRMTD